MIGVGHGAKQAGSSEWYTPPWLFQALGLAFDLDPCTPVDQDLPWLPAKRRYTAEDDGLSQPWEGRVWCNPPYGRATPLWLARMARHGDGVALVMGRTDTSWFHEAARSATGLLLLKGRVRFLRAGGGSTDGGCGSVLFAWGMACDAAIVRMAPLYGCYLEVGR